MKLVINTQHRENYGAHDWDGKGACPQYWKYKGGETYVVENLTPAQAMKIAESGIPTLTALIEHQSEAWHEYILGWELVDDCETPWAEWETPVVLSYVDGAWRAREVRENGEYGYFRKEIVRQVRTWTMQEAGEQEDITCVYDMEDGTTVPYSGLAEWLDGKEAA